MKFDHKSSRGWLSRQRFMIPMLAAMLLGLLWAETPVTAQVEPLASTWHVDIQSGADTATCGTVAAPCKSIQQAVNRAATGDQILVAAGVYRYAGANNGNPCDQFLGLKAVVCMVNKKLTIAGGYSSGNWSTPNPTGNLTVIDGEDRFRGVYVLGADPNRSSDAGIDLHGFTVRQGYTGGASAGDDNKTFGFGGGMLTDNAAVALRDMVFEENVVQGGSTQQSYGGAASGGALAIRRAAGVAILEDLIFRNNRAEGGAGLQRGGHGIGGAVYFLTSTAQGNRLTFTGNSSRGGNTSGAGVFNGERGDAFGPAVAIMGGSDVTLEDIVATDNLGVGGNAATYAGGAFGGAFKVEGVPWNAGEAAALHLINADVRQNTARGGNGAEGGIGAGGGLESFHADTIVERSSFIDNLAQGGDGTRLQGPAGGGGLYFQNNRDDSSTATVKNSVIANNEVRLGSGGSVGGGGGGIWLQGIQAAITHNTIAQNRLVGSPTQGSALMVLDDGVQSGAQMATLNYNIIAEHNNAGSAALHVKPGNSAQLNKNLFSANVSENVNSSQVGTITGMATSILAANAAFLAPGAPAYDYGISPFSPAVNAAAGSTETQDRYAAPRIQTPDIGAVEAKPFAVTVAIGDSALRVLWGENPGVRTYKVTVGCPDGANAPAEVACDAEQNVPGTATGTQYSGLSNYMTYNITVSPIVADTAPAVPPTVGSAFPTDLLVYLPVVLGK